MAFARGLSEGCVVAVDTSEQAVYQTIDANSDCAVLANNQFERDDDDEEAK